MLGDTRADLPRAVLARRPVKVNQGTQRSDVEKLQHEARVDRSVTSNSRVNTGLSRRNMTFYQSW